MTITAEPPSQTLPQYRHQPLHIPDSPLTSRLSVVGTMHDRFDEILTDAALDFVCELHGQFAGRRAELLAVRRSHGTSRATHSGSSRVTVATRSRKRASRSAARS